MSAREIQGGDKIITKNRLFVELHAMWLKILPYLSKAISPQMAILNTYQITQTSQDVLTGTNEQVRTLLNSWLSHRYLTFEVENTVQYTDENNKIHRGRTWNDLELSQHQQQVLKDFVDKTLTTDYETQVFVNNSSNSNLFNYAGLKFVEIQLSSDAINEAYIRVGLDIDSIPSGAIVDFNVVGEY